MTSARGPRLEFAVGAFLLLALASLLVLAVASTNGQFGFARGGTYELTARFTNLGQLRPNAPVKIGGVTIGRVTRVDLDPVRFDSVVTLAVVVLGVHGARLALRVQGRQHRGRLAEVPGDG